MLTTVLFVEYRSYQHLTADLLELQSVYQSYLLFNKEDCAGELENQTKPFAVVNRSAWNLKNLFKRGQSAVRKVTSTPVNTIFIWPVAKDSFWISSFYGPRKLGRSVRMHTGIDLAALKGTPIKAASGGKIVKACYEFGYGNTVIIEHNRKYKTRYAHMNEIQVKVGQVVAKGHKIGTVGDTGFVQSEGSNASHLHFEVYAFNKHVNPIKYLPKR